jgi:hypothetical protein
MGYDLAVVRTPPSLFRPEAYLAQLDRLRVKSRQRHGASPPESEGVALSELYGADVELCRAIASDVGHGTYKLAPLRRTAVRVEGQRRTYHPPDLLDARVLGALSARQTGVFEYGLYDSVHA